MEKEKPNRKVNPYLSQDRVADMWEMWNKYRYLMFPQQKSIYENIYKQLNARTCIEIGCGIGLGTGIVERGVLQFTATDILQNNVDFAKCLYPWINFLQWDVLTPYPHKQSWLFETAIAVEIIEHVANANITVALNNILAITSKELWLSTPNGWSKKNPPDNPYHTYEYTQEEVEASIPLGWKLVNIYDHNFKVADVESDPLVYRITKV